MRRFVARAHGCGVTSASDTDFGRIVCPVVDKSDGEQTDLLEDSSDRDVRRTCIVASELPVGSNQRCAASNCETDAKVFDDNVKDVADKIECDVSTITDKLSHLSVRQRNDILA